MSTEGLQASRAMSNRLATGNDNSLLFSKLSRKRSPASSSRDGLLAVTDHSGALTELNKKALPQILDGFPKLGYNTVLDESQAHLFKVLFLLYFYGLSILFQPLFVCVQIMRLWLFLW